jgi:penicillin amidase
MPKTKVKISKLVISLALVCSVAILLSVPISIIPPLGGLIDPFHGIWTVSFTAEHPAYQVVVTPGLSAKVTVIRDSWGVPHIYAANDHDLYYALGYVQAQDRLWQMDMMRRQGHGTLAEILGEDYVDTDLYLRTIGMEHGAQLTLQAIEQQTDEFNRTVVRDLSAFADGVNWFITTAGDFLPLEFKLLNYRPQPWTLLDSLVYANIMAYSLTWDTDDIQFAEVVEALGNASAWELFPLVPPLQIPVVPEYGQTYPPAPAASSDGEAAGVPSKLLGAINEILDLTNRVKDPLGFGAALRETWVGSNNWAVNSSKSATGKPILCNDMHLQWSVPSIWYEAHLVSASSGMNVYGFLIPGIPVIAVGHNEHLAWGFTNVGGDVLDWYYYNWNPDNSDQYWYNGEWRTVETEETVIYVKGAAPVVKTIRRTVHGPILTEDSEPMAQQWTADMASHEMQALYKMDRATNLAEFLDGQRYWWILAQNIVYADHDGNIAIRPTGHFPIRSSGYGRLPVNGSAGEGEWISYIPFDQLPYSLNPSRGYVASANQLSALYPNYPYYIHSFPDPSYRARRINEVLNSDLSVTVADMQHLQFDFKDTAAEAFVPYLISAFDAAPIPELNDTVDILRTWNYTMLKDWVAPTIWTAWSNYYTEAVFADEYAQAGIPTATRPYPGVLENLTRFNPTSHWFDNMSTVAIETCNDTMLSALRSAVTALEVKLGSDTSTWTWGSVHFVRFTHLAELDALGHGPYSYSGGSVTVNPSATNIWATPPRNAARGGASERVVVDLNNLLNALSVIPGGQSGNPLSHHYADQLKQLYLVGGYHVDYLYADADLLTDSESILILMG